MVDEEPTDTTALVLRMHADLLDVHGAVDVIDQHVADGSIRLVDGHPRPTSSRCVEQLRRAGRLVVGDLGHADVAEPLPRRHFDAAHRVDVVDPQGPDTDGHHRSQMPKLAAISAATSSSAPSSSTCAAPWRP